MCFLTPVLPGSSSEGYTNARFRESQPKAPLAKCYVVYGTIICFIFGNVNKKIEMIFTGTLPKAD